MADNTVDGILLEINATTDKADGGIGKTIRNLKSLKEVTEGIDTEKLLTIRDVFNGFKTAGESLKQAGDGMRGIASAVKSLSDVNSGKLKEVANAVEKIGAGLGSLDSNNKISIQIDSNGIDKAVKPLQEAQAVAAKSGVLEPYKDFEARLQNVGRSFSFSGSGQELADEIARAEARLDSLIAKEEKLKITGGVNENSQSYRNLQYDIAEVCNRLDVLYDRMQNETAAAQNATIISEQVRSAMEGAAQSAERLSSAEERTTSAGNAAAAAQQAFSGSLNQTNTNSANAQIQELINKINEYKATISGMESGKQLFDSQSYEEAVSGLARVQEQFKQYQNSVKNAPKTMDDVARSIKSIGDAAGKCGLGNFSSILNNIAAMLPTIEIGGMAANAGFQSMAVGLQAVQAAIPIIGIILTLISMLVNAVNSAANKIKTAFGKINAGFKTVVSKIRTGITKMMHTLGEWKNKFLEMFGVQENAFESLRKKLKSLTRLVTFMALRKIITKIFEGAAEGFQNLAKYSKIYGTQFNQNVSLLYSDLKWLGNSISTVFEPILNYITPILDMLITKLVAATQALAQFFSALTGKKYYTKAIKNWYDYADSVDTATKAIKDYTIEMDELHILNDDDNSSGAGAGGINPGDMFETAEVEQKYKDLIDMIKKAWENADFYELGRLLGEKLKEALESIPWDKIKATLRKIAKCIATFLNGFLETPGLFYVIGVTIAEAINSAFEFVDSFVENFHWESLGRAICDLIIGALDTLDWPLIRKTMAGLAQGLVDTINVILQTDEMWIKLGTAIANTINAAILFAKTAILGLDWASLGRTIGNLLGNALAGIDYEGIGVSFAGFVNGIFTAVLNFSKTFPWTEVATNFANGINTAIDKLDWSTIKKGFTTLCEGIGSNLDAAIKGINWKKIGMALGEGINTIISGIGTFIKSIDPAELGNSIADFINGAFEAFNSKDAVDTINSIIKWLKTTFETAIKKVDWKEVFNDLGTLLEGIDWYGIFSLCFEAIASVWTFKKIFKGKAIVSIGKSIVDGIKDGIDEAIGNIGEWIYNHTAKPVIDKLKEAFGISGDSSSETDAIGKSVVTGFIKGINANWLPEPLRIAQKFGELIQSIKNIFGISSESSTEMEGIGQNLVIGFNGGISAKFEEAKEKMLTFASNVKEWFAGTSFGAVCKSTWETYGADIVSGFKDKVSNAYTTTKDSITTWAAKLKEWFNSSSFGGVNNSTWTSYANEIITGFKNKVGNTYATTKDNITTWASKLKEWFSSSSFGGINNSTWTTYAGNIITGFKEKIGNSYGTTQANMTTWASALKNWFSGSGYGNITNSQWSTYAGNIISGFKNKISSSYTECQSGITTWASKVKEWFTDKCSSSTFYNVASDVISGFKNGIGELYTTCKDNISSWGSSIISWFKEKLDINSPSKVFEELGQYTVDGYANGISANGESGIKGPITLLAENIKKWFTDSGFGNINKGTWETYAGDIVSAFANKIGNSYTAIKDNVTIWATKTKQWFSDGGFGAVNNATWTMYANNVITGFKDKIGNTYTTTKSNIITWATSVKEWYTSNSFGGVNSTTWSTYAGNIITGFKDKVSSAYTTVQSSVTTWANKVREWYTSSSYGGVNSTNFQTYATDVIDGFKTRVGNYYTTVQSNIVTWGSKVRSWFTDNGGVNSSNFSTFATNVVDGFKNRIGGYYTTSGSNMTTWGSYVKTTFQNAGANSSSFYDVASDVVSGFKNGIGALYTTCKNNIESWGSSIISWFKDKLGVKSPSKVFREIGGFTVAGFNKGIAESGDSTRGIVQTWADSFSDVEIGFKVGVDTSALKEYQNNYGTDFTNKAMIERVQREVTTNGAVKATLNTSGGVKEVFSEMFRDVLPILSDIATNTKVQADKEEQTIVQIGGKTVTDAVETQQSANGYRFRPT